MLNENLEKLLLKYSFEDLARSFFVLNLWLPNVSSPIKSQFLYVVLEAIFDKLPKENRIKTYQDFKAFCDTLLPLTPSFPMMEDYLPENDWGEVKFFINKKFYKIFYGGDLSNPYDFYYSFEVIHGHSDDFYMSKLDRSPLRELEWCASVQDEILSGIDVSTQDKRDVNLAEFETPPEEFWNAASVFLAGFDSQKYDKKLLVEYTKDLDSSSLEPVPNKGDFSQRVHDGKNCFYFFVKKEGKIFPVLPRKYFAVLFDKWGKILNDQFFSIEKEVKHSELSIGIELYHFIKRRAKEEDLFFICNAIKSDLTLHKIVFTTAFRSRNKLILIHVLPSPHPGFDQQKHLDSLIPELKEAHDLLATSPTRIGLYREGKMVQFGEGKDEGVALEPLIITVVPHSTTDFGIIGASHDLVGKIIGLDSFLGILDEIKELDELSDFFDYVENMRSSFSLSPMSSLLDQFGSFRDSSSVLIAGADSPDMVALDPHWGTSYRYRSLTEFWEIFPQENFFGHPRSWAIEEQSRNDKILILTSKTFMGYAYCYTLDQTFFFVNCPPHVLSLEQGKITDLLMGSLADGIVLYEGIIKELPFVKTGQKIHALFFPLSLVEKDSDFSHLNHLKPSGENLWEMDITRLRHNDFGVRIFFDDKKILDVLKDAQDRTVQIQLLIDVLTQIDSIFGDANFDNVVNKLEPEKAKKNRFRMFAVQQKVSFPEFVRHVIPDNKEIKLANKKIAEIAKANAITEGDYSGADAQTKINTLKEGLISALNDKVKEFSLKESIPFLISNIDGLTNDHERKKMQVKNSLDQDVDYQREEFSGEDKQYFLHHHKNYRYLIEKFVQLQPTGSKQLNSTNLCELLAYVGVLLNLYHVSDFLHYVIYPSTLKIEHDFQAAVNYGADIHKMQTDYVQQQAKINLGMVGNKEDRLGAPFNVAPYLEKLDKAFKTDVNFGLKDMVKLLQVLSEWTFVGDKKPETAFYVATTDEIKDTCVKAIKGFDPSKTQAILDFVTLDPEKILIVEGSEDKPPHTASDLPVWEYRKRATRYTIKPVIKINEEYYWGAHSTERSARIWGDIAGAHKLPADINAPTTVAVLEEGHRAIEGALQDKIIEIVNRSTTEVGKEINPHKLGIHSTDIGDIDVFVLLREKSTILNIESKIIDQAFCNKDLQRIARSIFGYTSKKRGTFVKGYLQKVEDRAAYLGTEGKTLAERCWGSLPDKPKIVSIFVTQTSYWWTMHPPVETDVHFVELELLEDFIKKL